MPPPLFGFSSPSWTPRLGHRPTPSQVLDPLWVILRRTRWPRTAKAASLPLPRAMHPATATCRHVRPCSLPRATGSILHRIPFRRALRPQSAVSAFQCSILRAGALGPLGFACLLPPQTPHRPRLGASLLPTFDLLESLGDRLASSGPSQVTCPGVHCAGPEALLYGRGVKVGCTHAHTHARTPKPWPSARFAGAARTLFPGTRATQDPLRCPGLASRPGRLYLCLCALP